MISRVLGAAVLAAGLSVAPVVAGPASAVGVSVDVVNMSFTPATVKVPIGGTVTWNFQDAVTHNTTSNQGFWASGPQSSGDTFSHTFTSSGSYGYTCTIHPSMRGTVRVPVKASGSPSAGWTLRWAAATGTGSTTFDVQVRKPGTTTWSTIKNDTTLATARFNPARSGRYAVRARTNNGSQASGWSPVKSVTIT